jgi:hypothetical protein
VAITFIPNALIPVCLLLVGFGLSGTQTLTNILFSEVADEAELRSGVRRSALLGIKIFIGLIPQHRHTAGCLVPVLVPAEGYPAGEGAA